MVAIHDDDLAEFIEGIGGDAVSYCCTSMPVITLTSVVNRNSPGGCSDESPPKCQAGDETDLAR